IVFKTVLSQHAVIPSEMACSKVAMRFSPPRARMPVPIACVTGRLWERGAVPKALLTALWLEREPGPIKRSFGIALGLVRHVTSARILHNPGHSSTSMFYSPFAAWSSLFTNTTNSILPLNGYATPTHYNVMVLLRGINYPNSKLVKRLRVYELFSPEMQFCADSDLTQRSHCYTGKHKQQPLC
uniref:Uncharacterized protein n=1 Tax=Echinococcus canadensis TaxID=519352 RepID=A0A915EYL2_9CEST